MTGITISNFSISPSYVTYGQTFNASFKITNNTTHTMRYWSVSFRWKYNGSVVGYYYAYGKGTGNSASSNGVSMSSLDSGSSRTVSIKNITCANMQVNDRNSANQMSVTVCAWRSSDMTTKDGDATSTISATYVGGYVPPSSGGGDTGGGTQAGTGTVITNTPVISSFTARRESNESKNVIVYAKGYRDGTGGNSISIVIQKNGSTIATPSLEQLTNGYTVTRTNDIELFQEATYSISFTIDNQVARSSVVVPTANINLHLAACESGGVSIGKYSRSTEGKPEFEVDFPSNFTKKVTMTTGLDASGGNTLSGGVTVNGGETVNGTATMNNGATIHNGLTVNNGGTWNGGLTVNSGLTVNHGLTVNGGISNIRRGTTDFISVPSGDTNYVGVLFSPAMAGTPTVVCSLYGGVGAGAGSMSCEVQSGSVSSVGFNVYVANKDTSAHSVAVSWIAIY